LRLEVIENEIRRANIYYCRIDSFLHRDHRQVSMSREFHRVLGEFKLAAEEMRNAEVELGIATCCDSRASNADLRQIASPDYRSVLGSASAVWI
jgi:hypothetical protein